MPRTHYEDLQVSRHASDRVIRAAYKTLAQQWHPDRHPNDKEIAERITKIINEAYRVLSDPDLRKEHDAWILQTEVNEAGVDKPSGGAEAEARGPAAPGSWTGETQDQTAKDGAKKRDPSPAQKASVGTRSKERGLVVLVAAGVLAAGINYVTVVAPNAALPEKLAEVHTEVAALAKTDQARETVERYFNAGQAALRSEDRVWAKEAIEQLEDVRAILEQEYTIRIVNRPGENTGVWRIPNMNTGARNYYIVVEAVDPSGRVLAVPIENEETRDTERVKQWGLRVDERTFWAVAEDKQDDGIIERDRFGAKARGELVPHYEMKTTGGAITQW